MPPQVMGPKRVQKLQTVRKKTEMKTKGRSGSALVRWGDWKNNVWNEYIKLGGESIDQSVCVCMLCDD